MMNFIHDFKFCIKNVLQSTIKKSGQTLVLAKSAYNIVRVYMSVDAAHERKKPKQMFPGPLLCPLETQCHEF